MPARQRRLPAWRLLPSAWEQILGELAQGSAIVLTLRFVPPAWADSNVDAPPGSKARTNHAVLAVGAIEAGDGQPDEVLIIKNSWGPAWGSGGYGFLSRRYFDQFTLRAHVLES